MLTYNDIKNKLESPLDCSQIKDLRGQYFRNRLLTNYENTDFSGCVLFHCYPSGISNALEINPAQRREDLTLEFKDLSRANLKRADLRGANLKNVNLQGANLIGADLRGADLSFSNLQGANLKNADLIGATLYSTNLQGADLRSVALFNAIIMHTNFQGADFFGTNFGKIRYLSTNKIDSETNFKNTNITQEQLDSMTFVEDED